jgi:hypothetical protein
MLLISLSIIIITLLVAMLTLMVTQFKEINRKLEIIYFQHKSDNNVTLMDPLVVGRKIFVNDKIKLNIVELSEDKKYVKFQILKKGRGEYLVEMGLSTFLSMCENRDFDKYLGEHLN